MGIIESYRESTVFRVKNGELIAENKGIMSWLGRKIFRRSQYKLEYIIPLIKEQKRSVDGEKWNAFVQKFNGKIHRYNRHHKTKIADLELFEEAQPETPATRKETMVGGAQATTSQTSQRMEREVESHFKKMAAKLDDMERAWTLFKRETREKGRVGPYQTEHSRMIHDFVDFFEEVFALAKLGVDLTEDQKETIENSMERMTKIFGKLMEDVKRAGTRAEKTGNFAFENQINSSRVEEAYTRLFVILYQLKEMGIDLGLGENL